jgi:tripartite-type tricarboxylate transporter receptor subunit TctC
MMGRWLATAVVLAALGFSWSLGAQTFPSKPIRLVYPFPEGTAFRPLAERMSSLLGQAVFIDPRPGGGSVIGAQFVKGQPADGYTILIGSNSVTIKSLGSNPQIDIRKDFTPVAPIFVSPLLITVNAEQIKGAAVRDLLDEARRRPGEINYASYGIGSGGHMAMAMLANEAGVSMTHIPYQGPAQAVADTIAGRTQVTATILAQVRAHVAALGGSGKLKALAVFSAERSPLIPDVPGMKESGFPQIDYYTWGGLLGPAGLPRDIVDVLDRAVNAALKDPAVIAINQRNGVQGVIGTPDDLARIIDREYADYTKLIRETGLRLE